MKLDTKKLKELCEAVIRDIGNDGDTPMGLDWGWANLCRESLPKLKAFLRAMEPEHSCGSGFPSIPMSEYEIWRSEEMDTLRKLFHRRGPADEYKSFPDFCLEQYEGSDGGKVKV